MLDLRERCTKMPSPVQLCLLDKLKASAANMQPTGVLCKQSNPAKEGEDMFTYKLTKTIFASCYHFMAVAAALKLFQQGQNVLGFFPKLFVSSTLCLSQQA